MFNFSFHSNTLKSWVKVGFWGIALTSTVAQAQVTQLAFMDFDNKVLSSTGGWTFGSQNGGKIEISADTTQNKGGSAGSLKGSYPVPTGAIYVWAGFDLKAFNTRDIYVEFDVKMPNATQGIKFFKIFGQRDAQGDYANTTFGLVSEADRPGSLTQISFGDGSDTGNDVANVVNLDGTYPDWVGRSWGRGASVKTAGRNWSHTQWGTGWHHFKVHIKFNTGSCISGQPVVPEVNDGEYYLEIDGTTYVDAKGLFNRHCKNLPIQNVNFFDWGDHGSKAFDVWFDNIRITTGGFLDGQSSPATNPPKSPPSLQMKVQ